MTPTTSPALDAARPMWRRVLLLAWPVFLQQMLIMLVGLYDHFLAGNNTPPDAGNHVAYQAALTNTNYMIWFMQMNLATMVTVGSIALVSRMVGAGDRGGAVRATHQSLLIALTVGCVVSFVGRFFLHDILSLLALDPATAAMAEELLTPILMLIMFFLMESAGLACLVGAGDTRMTLWVLGGVALLNMPLSWVLLHGWGPIPALGFRGITLGTALSHSAGCCAVLVALARGRGGLKFTPAMLKPIPDLIRRLLRVSVPASLDSVSMGLCQLWFLSLVNGLGSAATTAHGTAIRWESMGYLSGMAFGTAAAAIVGQNLGAKRVAEARHGGWTAFQMGCAAMTFMGVVFFAFAPPMFRLFNPFEHQRDVIELGVPVLRLVAFAMPPLAACIVFGNALRGAGDSRVPVLFTWVGFLAIRLPLAYLLIPRMGLFGAWVAMAVDLFLRGAMFTWRFAGGRWQRVEV